MDRRGQSDDSLRSAQAQALSHVVDVDEKEAYRSRPKVNQGPPQQQTGYGRNQQPQQQRQQYQLQRREDHSGGYGNNSSSSQPPNKPSSYSRTSVMQSRRTVPRHIRKEDSEVRRENNPSLRQGRNEAVGMVLGETLTAEDDEKQAYRYKPTIQNTQYRGNVQRSPSEARREQNVELRKGRNEAVGMVLGETVDDEKAAYRYKPTSIKPATSRGNVERSISEARRTKNPELRQGRQQAVGIVLGDDLEDGDEKAAYRYRPTPTQPGPQRSASTSSERSASYALRQQNPELQNGRNEAIRMVLNEEPDEKAAYRYDPSQNQRADSNTQVQTRTSTMRVRHVRNSHLANISENGQDYDYDDAPSSYARRSGRDDDPYARRSGRDDDPNDYPEAPNSYSNRAGRYDDNDDYSEMPPSSYSSRTGRNSEYLDVPSSYTSRAGRNSDFSELPNSYRARTSVRESESFKPQSFASVMTETDPSKPASAMDMVDTSNRFALPDVKGVSLEPEEKRPIDNEKNLKLLSMILVGIVIFAGIIAVIVLFTTGNKEPKVAGTQLPTSSPSAVSTISSVQARLEKLTSDPSVYLDSSSAQYQALRWVEEDSIAMDSGIDSGRLETRYALAVLYFSTMGNSWLENLGFLSNTDECSWNSDTHNNGVFCTNDEVTGIMLESNNAVGEIPEEIKALSNLKTFVLSNENRAGNDLASVDGRSLASLQYLEGLETLDLSNNLIEFTIPSEFGNLANLQELTLSNNVFKSVIPSELNNLTNLQRFSLDNNLLVGLADRSLSNLAKLEELNLSKNPELWVSENTDLPTALKILRMEDIKDFQKAELYTTFGRLVNLEELWIEKSNIIGTLPTELGLMTAMKRLDFVENTLTGNIPSTIGLMKSLLSVDFRFNQLEGPVPSELGDLRVLNSVHLGENKLSGDVQFLCANANIRVVLDSTPNITCCSCCTKCG